MFSVNFSFCCVPKTKVMSLVLREEEKIAYQKKKKILAGSVTQKRCCD